MVKGKHLMMNDGGSQEIWLNGKPLTIPHNNQRYGKGLPLEYAYIPLISTNTDINKQIY